MFHLRADRGDRIFQFFNILKSIACPNRDAKVHGDSFEKFQTCSEPGGAPETTAPPLAGEAPGEINP